jgi:hypothetical protein
MQNKNTQIFISYIPSDLQTIQPILHRLKLNGWHLSCASHHMNELPISACPVEDCDLVLAFISTNYIADKDVFVSELSYAACVLRKQYMLIPIEDLTDTPPDLEMLAAKDGFAKFNEVNEALANLVNTPLRELPPINIERRYALKPFEAGEKHYAFISYAHDDAFEVYPIIKELYEAGWNLWYDEGIRITERYLPEIVRHVRDCDVFLLFVTKCSIRRPFVIDFELAYAKKLGKRIVPVIMELTESLPEEISGLGRVAPDKTLQQALVDLRIKNYGKRKAVPPKDKKDEEYDLKQLTPLKDYKYRVSGNGIFLTKYTGNEINVVIPSEHCSLPVVALEKTFYNQKKIRSVECPETITLVKDKTFVGCHSLKLIVYKSTRCEISNKAYHTDIFTELVYMLISGIPLVAIISVFI